MSDRAGGAVFSEPHPPKAISPNGAGALHPTTHGQVDGDCIHPCAYCCAGGVTGASPGVLRGEEVPAPHFVQAPRFQGSLRSRSPAGNTSSSVHSEAY